MVGLGGVETGGAGLLLAGLLLGLRHALDPDHLAAVAAAVARERGTRAGRAERIAALWGLGHGGAVLLVGGALVLAGLSLPPWVGVAAEVLVGALLVGLGLDLLGLLRRERLHLHAHRHADGERHLHLHGHAHGGEHDHPHPRAQRRALVLGLAHGLAGSGTLAVLAATAAPGRLQGLLFLALFALGASAAMAAATALALVPIRLARRPAPRLTALLRVGAALVTIGVGAGLAAASLAEL